MIEIFAFEKFDTLLSLIISLKLDCRYGYRFFFTSFINKFTFISCSFVKFLFTYIYICIMLTYVIFFSKFTYIIFYLPIAIPW